MVVIMLELKQHDMTNTTVLPCWASTFFDKILAQIFFTFFMPCLFCDIIVHVTSPLFRTGVS